MRRFFFLFILAMFPLFSAPKLHIITVANYQAIGLERLLYTAEYFGNKITVLGMDKPYPNHFVKLKEAYDYVEFIPDTDVVLFLDAFDVIMLGNGDEILKRFLEFNMPCVFGSERHYHPKDSVLDLIGQYPSAPTSLQYLNSGTYIGYAGFIRSMIKDVFKKHYQMPLNRFYNRLNDDQFHFHRYFARHMDKVVRDVHAKIFFPLTNIGYHEIQYDTKDKTLYFEETKTYPLVIHGNGKGLPMMNYLFDQFFPGTIPSHEVK